jgi:hypothetical protein
MLHLLLLIN